MAVARTPVLIACLLLSRNSCPAQPKESAEEKARRIWEEAILAKGGREKLHGVASLAVSSRSPWGFRGMRRVVASYESLLVLPSKLWEWVDERPTVFGLRVRIIDLERNYFQMIYGEGGRRGPDGNQWRGDGRPNPPGMSSVGDVQQIQELQLTTLMETRWLKPVLKGTRDEWWNFKRVSIVETEVGGSLYDFYFDKKTRLPVRLARREPGPEKTPLADYRLGQYRDVSGIQLPHRVVDYWWPGKAQPQILLNEYQINVEYDEEVFRRPPSLDRGPKGWMKVAPQNSGPREAEGGGGQKERAP